MEQLPEKVLEHDQVNWLWCMCVTVYDMQGLSSIYVKACDNIIDFFSHGLIKDFSGVLTCHGQLQDGSCVPRQQ